MDFTVAIPTFNGASRVPFVLDRLREQQDLEEVQWEVIVVDNNSTDQIKAVVETYQQDFPCPLRYCFEEKQGPTHARRCAFLSSGSDLIGFLDDDNWPDPLWVKQAYLFGKEYPRVGAYGSYISPIFELDPPVGFNRISLYFAIRTEQSNYCYNDRYKNERRKLFPPSAGIVVRKSAWMDSVPQEQRLSFTSEDVEMLSYLLYDGWEIWHNASMKVQHNLPKERFEKTYLKKFFRNIGYTRYITRMQAYPLPVGYLLIPFYLLADLLKIIKFYYLNHKDLEDDPIKAGEWTFLISVPQGLFLYLSQSRPR